MAKVAIQHQGGQRTELHDQVPQGINHGFDPHQFWGERDGCLGFVRATGRTPWTTFGAWHERCFRLCFSLAGGLLRVAAHDLLHADRERVPLRDTDQGQREKGQPRHRLAIQTGKKSVQAIGVFAGFGGDDFIAHQQVHVPGTIDMMTKEHPKQCGPREHRREKALHRAVAAPFPCPARDA